MNNINDERHLNAIAKATEGEEWECEKEWREDNAVRLLNALKPSDPMQQLQNLSAIQRKLGDGV